MMIECSHRRSQPRFGSSPHVAVMPSPLPVALPQLVVADPLAALSAFAREWRRQFHIAVIGVTGSNGKTTTKELIGSILSRLGPTLVTRGNLNNHIGVPLTLLELTAAHRYAVIEMGANHQGEIAHLASIAEPTIGIVTNAGAAHLEGFGSLDGVASGKGEMFRAPIRPRGTEKMKPRKVPATAISTVSTRGSTRSGTMAKSGGTVSLLKVPRFSSPRDRRSRSKKPMSASSTTTMRTRSPST